MLDTLEMAKEAIAELMVELTLTTEAWAVVLDNLSQGKISAQEGVDQFTEFLKPVLLRDLQRMVDPMIGPIIEQQTDRVRAELDKTREGMVK